MALLKFYLNEFGVEASDENGKQVYLQLPVTPDSQNSVEGKPIDMQTAKEYQALCDEHFGQGDRTLARLCYAGGKIYDRYEVVRKTAPDSVFGVQVWVAYYDNDEMVDEFVEHPYSDYYNVEMYTFYVPEF